jgi:hypothetical protein
VRGGLRKMLHPAFAYERFRLLEASLPRQDCRRHEGVTCEVLDRHRAFSLGEVGWADGTQTVRRFQDSEASSMLQLAVASDERGIVGVCAFEENVIGLPGLRIVTPVPSYFVHFIGVCPRSRGRSVMGQLLACTDQYAGQRGAQSRFCLVASHNKASLRAFAKSGTHPIGVVFVVRIIGTPIYVVPRCLRAT